jgi:TRAP-type mannitol/chloroaromatic compound transport system substrate-binding protein
MKRKSKQGSTQIDSSVPRGRRRFLTAASGTLAAAGLGFPAIATSQTQITWRFQSTWPAKDIFHEYALDYARRVNEMSGNRFKLDVLPAGAVVGAFGMQDAVSTGVLDGGHGVCAYWYGKNKAFSLFGTAPSFGWNANELLGWFYYGDGEKLYQELINDILKVNVVGWLCGPMPTQPLGWFKKQITDASQMQKLKYRTVGLAADLMNEMGAAVTILAGGDIVPSMDRGVIDAAEFNNPSSDLALGFTDVSKVYMLQSFHQDLECFEIIFNKNKYNALPKELQAILKYSCEAWSADMSWKLQKRYPEDLVKIEKAGVKVYETPKSVLEAQLAAWDKLLPRLSKENAFFGKVVESQKAWAKTVVGFMGQFESPRELAANHYFGLKKAG